MFTTVFTCGDVNGIGPEIVVKSLNKAASSGNSRLIFTSPINVFKNTASIVEPEFSFKIVKKIPKVWSKDEVLILDIGNCRQSYGKITKSSGAKSYEAILQSCSLMENGTADAVVTAPISKFAFSAAGIDLPGHTELYAERFNADKFAMMFVSNKFKAGLATIHIPISSIKKKLNNIRIKDLFQIIENSLKIDFAIPEPKIAVLGLNPHAGENGLIGNEEEIIIKPLIEEFKDAFRGPFVPDAFFGNQLYKNFDCVIGMYHDQILIPFKLLNFNKGVNFTAGLPVVRTSPDHGTAFDIAGEGKADPGSMIEAFKFAQQILKNRRAHFEAG